MKWFEQQTVLANFFSVLYKIPTVKIDRDAFLAEQFEKSPIKHSIIAQGPIAAGITDKELTKAAKRVINKRTRQATTVSFAAGLPGGIAMAATVPTDTVQFLINALKMAQELAYLYGYRDFWKLKDDTRKNELLLFLGTMLEVKGGAAAMRLLTAQHAEVVAKKMSFSAVERAMYWPILGEIARVIVEKVTKKTMASGITKFIPLAGGFMSGGITYAALSNMGEKLHKALADGTPYTEGKMQADVEMIKQEMKDAMPETTEK